MSTNIKLNCNDLIDGRTILFEKHNWFCQKRDSYFDNIDQHCRDCERYEEMYEQLKKFIEGEFDQWQH